MVKAQPVVAAKGIRVLLSRIGALAGPGAKTASQSTTTRTYATTTTTTRAALQIPPTFDATTKTTGAGAAVLPYANIPVSPAYAATRSGNNSVSIQAAHGPSPLVHPAVIELGSHHHARLFHSSASQASRSAAYRRLHGEHSEPVAVAMPINGAFQFGEMVRRAFGNSAGSLAATLGAVGLAVCLAFKDVFAHDRESADTADAPAPSPHVVNKPLDPAANVRFLEAHNDALVDHNVKLMSTQADMAAKLESSESAIARLHEEMEAVRNQLALEQQRFALETQRQQHEFEVAMQQHQHQVRRLEDQQVMLEGEIMCIACNDQPRNVTYGSCRHHVVCTDCDTKILRNGNACPVCRAAITQRVQHFVT
ncbi:hypothetical protein CAOG_03195 [Capsaspora owczarzaki ATCC 30864]|uniref:RING-type domain-containing protein n=1 Tax=Capsaspora owczarzaki (strain ATCC 30864) TaxID=595528 RepID=A0A0D2X297_CAPO3|nr:hypothetical protein CAOG_03195 [Capsaspora owczarzaki ATCC 30864]KJE92179.1 hypothetical protein CAOG_003195 [Capsaspora owczarzaki ATCC 30864]|eukprot:XP_004364034.1 hypothetical protein CAOG_03195 [Capsaspora owczarzaki ATCC 30864]